METHQVAIEPRESITLESRLENIDIWQLADIVSNANDNDWEKAALSLLFKKLEQLEPERLKMFLDRQNNLAVRKVCVVILKRKGIAATLNIGTLGRILNVGRRAARVIGKPLF